MSDKSVEDIVSDYAMTHYVDDHCTLCGNSGVIDTTEVRTHTGLKVGRKNFCICPNGMSVRKHGYIKGVVYAILEASEWISVDTELPDRSEVAIVAMRNGGRWLGWFWKGKWYDENQKEFGVTSHGDDLTVTHWMPLPEPPEKSK